MATQKQMDDLAAYQKTAELDGCYFCGRDHKTDACDSKQDMEEFYYEQDTE